jgi:hypothetical protein
MHITSVQRSSLRAYLQKDYYFRAVFILFCLISAVVLFRLFIHSLNQLPFGQKGDYIQALESGNTLMRILGDPVTAWLFVLSLCGMAYSSFKKKYLLAGILFLFESSYFLLSVIQRLIGFRSSGCNVCGEAWFPSWPQIDIWFLTVPVLFLLGFSAFFLYEKRSIYFRGIVVSASVMVFLALSGFWFLLNSIT